MQAGMLKRPTSSTRTDLSTVARDFLESHPHFRGRTADVCITHSGSDLFLKGRLPSFYLKQLVQEAVRRVPGVQYVYNEIDVISADGISSSR